MAPACPLPPDEAGRLAALRSYRVLDTPPEQTFDDFAELASAICGTPIALVTLVDERRQWFKARVGLPVEETPREHAFCAHAIVLGDMLVVPDATNDSRFASNPLVTGEPRIRFYAGAPLRTMDGHSLGTLCVIDRVPRELSEDQARALRALSRQLMTLLELRVTTDALASSRAALAEEQTFTRALLDTMMEGIVILTVDGRIESVNPAAASMFGCTQDELRDRPIETLLAGDDRVAGATRAQLAAAIGKVTRWQGRRVTGETFPLESQVWVFGPSGRRKVACHVRDLTRQMEAELAKRRFVANVSHELRTPLTSIRGALGLMLDHARGTLADDDRDLLEVAHRNTMRLLALVNDLLEFEKGGNDQLTRDRRHSPLATVVERALETVRDTARDAGVSLAAPATRAQVFCDADRLSQVLVNLLANAIKFSPRGGVVDLSVEPLEDGLLIVVDDSGPGVPEQDRARIFEPFTQVEGSPAHNRGGTGLGLSIARRIVGEHGGTIDVSGNPRGGARFTVFLPGGPAPSQ